MSIMERNDGKRSVGVKEPYLLIAISESPEALQSKSRGINSKGNGKYLKGKGGALNKEGK